MAQEFCARLFPVAHNLGYFVETYSLRGQKFTGGRRPTWYTITAAQKAELEVLKQDQYDVRSRMLFEIVTPEEKAVIEQQDREKYMAMLGVTTSTVALPQSSSLAQTRDIRPADAQADPPPAGRAAALPPSNVGEGGALTTESLPSIPTPNATEG